MTGNCAVCRERAVIYRQGTRMCQKHYDAYVRWLALWANSPGAKSLPIFKPGALINMLRSWEVMDKISSKQQSVSENELAGGK